MEHQHNMLHETHHDHAGHVDNSQKANILRRLKIIEGHLKKVISMVEEDRYCIDVLQQSSAVRSALKKTQDLILTAHLDTCVLSALKDGRNKQVINELKDIYTQKK